MIKMSEEPDVGDYEEYVLSGIEDQASEEVAQKYEEIEKASKSKKQKAEEPNYDGYDDDGEIP